ncbi:MAG TPA: class I SAM-dependent methyltransferase [Nitriliruptorales bacterium]
MTVDPASPQPELVLTGERTLPGVPDERYWFARHVVAYRQACRRIAGRAVLDAGCGEGYGLAMLAQAGASRVIGVDVDPTVIAHVTRRYAAADARIVAVEAELGDVPLPDGAADRVVSFQVIEHLWDVPAYLAELRRLARPSAQVWVATPNRLTFTPGSDAPANPFHVREFTADELRDELSAAGLRVDRMLGVRHGKLLRTAEALLRRPLPEVLAAAPPEAWPRGTRRLVHRAAADWFAVCGGDLDTSLDLIAVARRR